MISMNIKFDLKKVEKTTELCKKYQNLAHKEGWKTARFNVWMTIISFVIASACYALFFFEVPGKWLIPGTVWSCNFFMNILIMFEKVRRSGKDWENEIMAVRHNAARNIKGAVTEAIELSKEFSSPGYDQHDIAIMEDARDNLSGLLRQLSLSTQAATQTQGNEVSASDRVTSKQIVSSAPVSTPHSKGVSLRKPSDSSGGGGTLCAGRGRRDLSYTRQIITPQIRTQAQNYPYQT